jgi:hypothetical protein
LVAAATGILACIWYSLGTVILASLAIAIVGGLAKLAVDASIQERIAEDVRASAFAHSETLLMLAFVVGGAIGLIPFNCRLGIIVLTAGMVVAAVYAWMRAINLRRELLTGSASTSPPAPQPPAPQPTAPQPTAPQPTRPQPTGGEATVGYPSGTTARTVELPGGTTYQQGHHVHGAPSAPAGSWWARRRAAKAARAAGSSAARRGGRPPAAQTSTGQTTAAQPTVSQPTEPQPGAAQPGRTTLGTTRVLHRNDDDQPGYHIYRPDSVRSDDDSTDT